MDPRVKPAGDAREWVSTEPIRTGTDLDKDSMKPICRMDGRRFCGPHPEEPERSEGVSKDGPWHHPRLWPSFETAPRKSAFSDLRTLSADVGYTRTSVGLLRTTRRALS